MFNEFFPVNIIVNKPPTISNSKDLTNFYEMVSELEGLPPSYGPDRTLLFLRPFERFDKETANLFSYLGYNTSNHELSYTNLDTFLETIGKPATIKTKKIK